MILIKNTSVISSLTNVLTLDTFHLLISGLHSVFWWNKWSICSICDTSQSSIGLGISDQMLTKRNKCLKLNEFMRRIIILARHFEMGWYLLEKNHSPVCSILSTICPFIWIITIFINGLDKVILWYKALGWW